jgi:ABC-2 type transport system ATP-binding protein
MDHGQILKMDSPDQLIDELLATGFSKSREVKPATLEDVFLNLTGREWREG